MNLNFKENIDYPGEREAEGPDGCGTVLLNMGIWIQTPEHVICERHSIVPLMTDP